jgi:GxxExxY protein
MTTLLHEELTYQIIGAYYTVYNKLSQTYPEFIYERAMIALLKRAGIHCVRQAEHQITYKDYLVGL